MTEHSRFRSDLLQRLQRTLDLMRILVFGHKNEAEAALRQFHAAHARVHGRLREAAGPFPAGTPYGAQDPALKLWVHAALINSHLLVYERFVVPLSPADRLRFDHETRLLAMWMGIPERMIPPTLEDFKQYVDGMLNGNTLIVTDTARVTAWALLDPPVWFFPHARAHLVRFVTAGLLLESLRRAYGLVWNMRREAVLGAAVRISRSVLPFVPSPLRLILGSGGAGFVRWALSAG